LRDDPATRPLGIVGENEGAKLAQIPIVERAMQLARSGAFTCTAEIDQALQKEGNANVPLYLSGKALRRQILSLCAIHGPPRRSHKRGNASDASSLPPAG